MSTPSRLQLELAHRQLRKAHWGAAWDSLDLALKVPLYRLCIEGLALHMNRAEPTAGHTAQPRRAAPLAFVPPTPTSPPLRKHPRTAEPDRKRLAANDRD